MSDVKKRGRGIVRERIRGAREAVLPFSQIRLVPSIAE